MKLLLFVVLLQLLRRAQGELVLEIKLIEYKNPDGRTYLDMACGPPNTKTVSTDSLESKAAPKPCQTGFLICLVDLPFRNPQNCSLGDVSTPVLGSTNTMDFNQSDDKYTYQFPIEQLPSVSSLG